MNMDTFDANLFRDRQVLVVGGTSGIGAGIAAAFVRHGAQVRVTGASDAEVDAAARRAAASGRRARGAGRAR